MPLLPLLLMLAALAAGPAHVAVHAKVYERCELARELLHVHRMAMDELAVWVCIARHESDFNTTAVGHVGEGGDHGLFQISDLYWCSARGPGKACAAACAQFEDDDIADDVACVRRIHREHQGLTGNGFNAWAVYPLYCKRPERVAKYVEGCFPGTGNELQPQAVYGLPPPAITAPPPPPHARPQPRPQAPHSAPGRPQVSANAISSRTGFGFTSFPSFTSFRGWSTPSRFAVPTTTTAARLAAPRTTQSAPAQQDNRFWTWQFGPKRRWF